MDKQEFIEKCRLLGYCSAKTAKEYSKTKDEFNDEDFEEVYRIDERRQSLLDADREKWRLFDGAKTTKRLTSNDKW